MLNKNTLAVKSVSWKLRANERNCKRERVGMDHNSQWTVLLRKKKRIETKSKLNQTFTLSVNTPMLIGATEEQQSSSSLLSVASISSASVSSASISSASISSAMRFKWWAEHFWLCFIFLVIYISHALLLKKSERFSLEQSEWEKEKESCYHDLVRNKCILCRIIYCVSLFVVDLLFFFQRQTEIEWREGRKKLFYLIKCRRQAKKMGASIIVRTEISAINFHCVDMKT